jgi:hypothetical protein
VDLGEMIASEALDRMTDDGLPVGEAALVLILTGLDRLTECCHECQAEALVEIRARLAELHRAQLAATVH